MVFKYWDNKDITCHEQVRNLTDYLGLNQYNLIVKSLLIDHENHTLIKNVWESFQISIFPYLYLPVSHAECILCNSNSMKFIISLCLSEFNELYLLQR